MVKSEAEIRKVTDSNDYYNLYVGDDEVMFEIPKTRFRGKKRPRAGDLFRLEQKNVEGRLVASIFVNNEQVVCLLKIWSENICFLSILVLNRYSIYFKDFRYI